MTYIGIFCTISPDATISKFSIIRSFTVIYSDVVIGEYFTTGHHVLIRSGCIIGNDVSIGSHTTLEGNLTIGNRVRIHSNCFIPELTELQDDCWIGPCVCITNDKHPGPSSGIPKNRQGVIVESFAVVGANATILPGVRIGHHALVGAGSVVTHDVAPHSTVVGNPARLI